MGKFRHSIRRCRHALGKTNPDVLDVHPDSVARSQTHEANAQTFMDQFAKQGTHKRHPRMLVHD